MDCDCWIRLWRVGPARYRRLHSSLPLCFQSLEHGSCTPLSIIHQNSRRAAYRDNAGAVQNRGTISHPSGNNQVIPAPRSLRPPATDNWPLTTGHRRWTVGPFRPSLVRGDSPRNAPLVYAGVRARFQRVRQRPGSNATVPARFQPVAIAPRNRCRCLRAPIPAVPGH